MLPPPIPVNPNPWVMCCTQGVKALLGRQPDANSSQVSDGQQITPGTFFLALNLLFPSILIQLLEIKFVGALPLSQDSYWLTESDKNPGSPPPLPFTPPAEHRHLRLWPFSPSSTAQ